MLVTKWRHGNAKRNADWAGAGSARDSGAGVPGHYTKHKDVVDIGPIHATADEHKTIPLPPILGAIALVGGIILIARDRK